MALAPKKNKLSLWQRIRQNSLAYKFIAPTFVAMMVVHLIPIVQGLYLSLLDVRLTTLTLYLKAPFVGLKYYIEVFNAIFGLGEAGASSRVTGLINAASNTLVYTIWTNIGTLGLGLMLAMLLNREFRWRGIARTLVLLPWVVPTFVTGTIFNFIWLEQGGLANKILLGLNIVDTPVTWLIGPNSLYALVIATVWRGLPFTTIMFLAAIQVIPTDLYEAASLDGANGWQRFRHITLPLIKPIAATQVLFGLINGFYGGYNIAVQMFGGGTGFAGEYADLLVPAITRQTWERHLYGFGSAASVILMGMLLVFVGIWYRAFRESLRAE